MMLRDIGEFGLIERIHARFGRTASGSDITTAGGGAPGSVGSAAPGPGLGIGDDCAVIERPGSLLELVTTDLLIEGSHFLRDAIEPRQLGRKSLAVNLSDVAAMGGKPRAAFLSLALPGEIELSWIDAFFEGVGDRLSEAGAELLGGDTTRSKGPIVIQFTILGDVERAHLKLRAAAEPGDILCVTDQLGDSGGGLQALLDGVDRTPAVERLVRKHLDPRPHLAEGAWLGSCSGVRAMIDLSDGLESDVRRIMERSGCGAEIEVTRLPTSRELEEVCAEQGWSAWELAVGGGEDYALLCSVAPEQYEQIAAEFQREFGRELHAVGRVTAGRATAARSASPQNKAPHDAPFRRNDRDEPVYLQDGRRVDPTRRGFDHFHSE